MYLSMRKITSILLLTANDARRGSGNERHGGGKRITAEEAAKGLKPFVRE